MKFKQLLMSALMVALAGFFVVGCNENPDNPDTDVVAPPTNLMAVSMDGGVGLQWTASADAASYTVTWNDGTADQTEEGITTTAVDISGLVNGTTYTFVVVAVDASGEESDKVSISWAPAKRYNSDVNNGGTLRLYPRSVSGKGSGIVIQDAGAYTASVASGSPDLAKIHLIGDVNTSTAQFRIGVPQSFTDFGQVANFRTDVQISDGYEEVDNLDDWYNEESLDNLFTTGAKTNFERSDKFSSGKGMAFAMRWGTAGSYRYARIFVVPDTNGNLVQKDSSGDQYIEVRISYQSAQGVPYAK